MNQLVSITSSSAYSISIASVLVESERFNGESYEIGRNISEISIFEHIDLPYLTATLLISDSSNLLHDINFQGTERVTIELKIDGDPTSTKIKKEFIVSSIGGIAPSGDTSETISLNLHETHAYLNNIISVSKAYAGKPEKIINDILKDNLEISIDTPKTLNEDKNWVGSISPTMKVIIPAWSTLDACRWIKDRMMNENGSPFFLYSNINNDNLILTDLETILNNSVNNENNPYIYSQSYIRETSNGSVIDQSYAITNYKIGKSSDVFNLYTNGGYGVSYKFVDVNLDENIVSASIKQNTDTKFKINDIEISDFTSNDITQISASHTFSEYANYYEHKDASQKGLSATSTSLRKLLVKNPIDIIVPGWNFLGRGKNITIGSKIHCQFLKNDPEILMHENEKVIDETRSGEYLIYSARHMIKQELYEVSLTGVKV